MKAYYEPVEDKECSTFDVCSLGLFQTDILKFFTYLFYGTLSGYDRSVIQIPDLEAYIKLVLLLGGNEGIIGRFQQTMKAAL